MVANTCMMILRRPGTRDRLMQPPVPVWDARLSRYREVTLEDRNDPLWSAARALAALRTQMTVLG